MAALSRRSLLLAGGASLAWPGRTAQAADEPKVSVTLLDAQAGMAIGAVCDVAGLRRRWEDDCSSPLPRVTLTVRRDAPEPAGRVVQSLIAAAQEKAPHLELTSRPEGSGGWVLGCRPRLAPAGGVPLQEPPGYDASPRIGDLGPEGARRRLAGVVVRTGRPAAAILETWTKVGAIMQVVVPGSQYGEGVRVSGREFVLSQLGLYSAVLRDKESGEEVTVPLRRLEFIGPVAEPSPAKKSEG